MFGLKDKVVLVTGGGGGIGSAICKRFGQAGAKVAVVDINQEAGDKVVEEIKAAGGFAQTFLVDLTSQESVIACVGNIESTLGPIDALVNNAGWDRAGNFLDTNKDLWEKIVPYFKNDRYSVEKVKGHADDFMNNEVDRLAVAARIRGEKCL